MENLTEFIATHYGWFLTITILLLFALIGYIVDSKREKSGFKNKPEEIDEEYIKHLASINTDRKILGENSQNNNVENAQTIDNNTNVVNTENNTVTNENNNNN